MALNIPNTELPGNSFLKGVNTGSSMFSRLIEPVIARERQKQQAQQFLQELELHKQQEARRGANTGLSRQILQQKLLGLQHSNDPNYKFNQLKNLIDNLGSIGGNTPNPNQGQTSPSVQEEIPQSGQPGEQPQNPQDGGISPGQPQPGEPPQANQQGNDGHQLPGGLDINEIKKALIYQSLGLKPPANGVFKEPPEIKRQNDLRAKMEAAKYNHELRIEEEKIKKDLQNEQTRFKIIESAKTDIPKLNETLRSLQVMQKIADDPKNDDLFGHWIEGHDVAARRSENPNAGVWQAEGIAPIIKLENEISSRGNQLALKASLSNKPNFAETRAVAAAKIKTLISQIQRRIKENQKIANESSTSPGSEEIKELGGKKYKKISGEWHEVY